MADWTPKYGARGAWLFARNVRRVLLENFAEAREWAASASDPAEVANAAVTQALAGEAFNYDATAHAAGTYTGFPVLLVFPMQSPRSRQGEDKASVEFRHRVGVEMWLTGTDQEALSILSDIYLRAGTEIVWKMKPAELVEGADRSRFSPPVWDVENIDFDLTRRGGQKYLRIPSFEVVIDAEEQGVTSNG